jgi:hypothetical protein
LNENDLCQIIFCEIFFISQIVLHIIEDLENDEGDQKNEGVAEVVVEGVDYFLQRYHKATHLTKFGSF